MEIRQMATAFLFRANKVLMMRKARSRFVDFEFWSGLGGHLEPEELNCPKRACIREIYEESGFEEKDIFDLKLRYILLRIKEAEIRQQFVYFGRTDRVDFIQSAEGELFWKDRVEVLNLHMSQIVKHMLAHYFQNPNREKIIIGAITLIKENKPQMQWSELNDPLVF